MSRHRSAKPALKNAQREWRMVLNRPEARMLDKTLEYVIDSLLSHSGESGPIPFAQRLATDQLRALQEKLYKS